jgi:5'-3' exonuclease
MDVIHLVDASFFVFRAYYSVPDHLADKEGRPVNAVYGFARFLSDLLERESPTHMVVAFDESLAGSFRNRLYPPYKANRDPPPDALREQFQRCRELCAYLGLTAIGSAEYEADDIIGSVCWAMRRRGFRSTIISRDKDLSQLIRIGDEFWDYMADQRIQYADIADRFGVKPESMADYLALTGDAVDNIPGVPGIGPKTAAVLLTRFSSLDEIYAGLEYVPMLNIRGAAGLPKRLLEHRQAAFLARELTRIACDMPLSLEVSDVRCRAPQLESLAAFYDRAAFGPMLRLQAQRLVNRHA